MKIFKRIFYFILSFSIYFIIKELILLVQFSFSIHQYFGWLTVLLLSVSVIYFVLIPMIKIISLPKTLEPTADKNQIDTLRKKRIDSYSKRLLSDKNKSIIDENFYSEENYNKLIEDLKIKSSLIKKRYITNTFYSTAISQNGFLDALLILSNGFKMVKEIFELFNGRVNNRDLLKIFKNIYFSMLIGGSEGVEYASEEIFRKLAFDGLNKIPFADKIFSSLTDGFVNASLITRVAIITENYCTMLYIKSPKDLNPTIKAINHSTKIILNDVFEKVKKSLLSITKDKTGKLLSYSLTKAYSPIKYVFELAKTNPENEDNSSDNGILKRLFRK
ncbi:MAG: hypothetical protein JEY94_17090 [Melioribacteraceae bacterium]|nr:hypothetical protein [Melioribacteraceae bacterium]